MRVSVISLVWTFLIVLSSNFRWDLYSCHYPPNRCTSSSIWRTFRHRRQTLWRIPLLPAYHIRMRGIEASDVEWKFISPFRMSPPMTFKLCEILSGYHMYISLPCMFTSSPNLIIGLRRLCRKFLIEMSVRWCVDSHGNHGYRGVGHLGFAYGYHSGRGNHGNGACCHGNRLCCHGKYGFLHHVTKMAVTWHVTHVTGLVDLLWLVQKPYFSILLASYIWDI